MNLLVDTHAFVWWLNDSPRLGRGARAEFADPTNRLWISAVSAWEIAIKVGVGRLELREPPEVCVPREIERGGFRALAVELDHALGVVELPPHHGDPFDRLLIAQARAEGLTIVTADRVFEAYQVATLAADR